jgi:hypothetical protein
MSLRAGLDKEAGGKILCVCRGGEKFYKRNIVRNLKVPPIPGDG